MKLYAILIGFLLANSPSAQDSIESHHHGGLVENLGTVSFPISCVREVQKPFESGVALLHSYWYEEAEKQFEAVAAKNPSCAMAYWGQAMTLHRPAYSRPTQEDLKRGWELIQKAKVARTKSSRESEYIDALAGFYAGENVDYEKRAATWCAGMKRVYNDYPKDQEAAAFYSLSLLVSEPPDDKSLANSRKAIEILDRLLEQAPNHPGAAHYLIHAADNPNLAELGLPAARRYAQIAPSVPHALHMPSHIFARLGLWPEDIQSNLASLAAARQDTGMHIGAENQVHALEFLEYAYLQTGEGNHAQEMIEQMRRVRKEDLNAGLEGYLEWQHAQFPAKYALEMRDWKAVLALKPESEDPLTRSVTYWANAIAAGHLRDAAMAREVMAQFEHMVETVRTSNRSYRVKGMETNQDEARAWMSFAEGENEEALALFRKISEKQDAFGKGEVELPAREMLADMLLELRRPQEALSEYEKSLKSDPNRLNGLYGAGRAAELTGQAEKAREFYQRLLKNCEQAAPPLRQELLHAQDFLGAHPKK